MVGRYRTMTKPIKFADTPGPTPSPSPTFGQHRDEVLSGYGYSPCRNRGATQLGERGIVR